MTEFRYSKRLEAEGINYQAQGLIYFTCVNIKKLTRAAESEVLNICISIAEEEYGGLFRFLTDSDVNHEYIELYYHIPPKRLFAWKRQFYRQYYKFLRSR